MTEVLIPLQSDATMASIQSGIEEHGGVDLGWNTGDPRMRLYWSERVMDRAEAIRILLAELDKHNIRPVTSEEVSSTHLHEEC